jgi:hypothetical protein
MGYRGGIEVGIEGVDVYMCIPVRPCRYSVGRRSAN